MSHQIDVEIAALEAMDLQSLRRAWADRYGGSPKLRSADLLRRNLAWRMQAEIYGGLDPETRRRLKAVGGGVPGDGLAPGTKLARDWLGIRHEVIVQEQGYSYAGKRYANLSQIARLIAGARWKRSAIFWSADGGETMSAAPTFRCAIYTRKSSEEGLEQGFNSLHAQRDACEAYIRSQRGEGWWPLKVAYDDGGISGGTMERPGLRRLLADIAAARIDVVVVYKVDRLTRSLMDFAKIVEIFDRHGVSFVSVTQAFNTTTSMGRLTLNVLLSFAQFEREVTGERIRDKIAASKKKGLWMGGNLPLGYDASGRTLTINTAEAEQVRHIFQRYIELRSVHLLRDELDLTGVRSKQRTTRKGVMIGGGPMNRGALFHLLANRVYLGEIPHKAESYPGQHAPIIDKDTFEAAQAIMALNRRRHGDVLGKAVPSPLTGKIFDGEDRPMGPTSATGKGGGRYRYYVTLAPVGSMGGLPRGRCRTPSAPLEAFVADAVSRCVGASSALPWAQILPILTRVTLQGPQVLVALHIASLAERGLDQAGALVVIRGRLLEGERAWLSAENTVSVTMASPAPLRSKPGEVVREGGLNQRAAPRPNKALVAALRRAHRVASAASASPLQPNAKLHQATGIVDPYERRLVRLAFLAPAIQQAIFEGRQPAALTLQRLMDDQFPVLWQDQLELLSGSRASRNSLSYRDSAA